MCELLVSDALDAVDDRLPFGGAALTLFQEALGLGLHLGSGALADGTAIDVILDPPNASRCAIPRLLFVQRPHHPFLSPAARAGYVLGKRNDASGTLRRQDLFSICSRQAFQASMRWSRSTLSKSSFRSSAPAESGTLTRFRTPLASRSRTVHGETPR